MKINRKKELEHKKQELKEDAFVTSITTAWQRTSEVRTYVIAGLVGLVLIGGIMMFMSYRKKSTTDQSWQALAAMEAKINEMKVTTEEERAKQEDARLAELDKLAKETDGSNCYPTVLFYHANALFRKGGADNVKKAEEECTLFLERYPDHYFAITMKQLLAKTLFEQKSCDKALAVFKEVHDVFRSGKPVRMASLEYEASYYIGRCQELLGQLADARKTYDELSSNEKGSPWWAEMAKYRLSKMNS